MSKIEIRQPGKTWIQVPGTAGYPIDALRHHLEMLEQAAGIIQEQHFEMRVGCLPVRLLRVTRRFVVDDLGAVHHLPTCGNTNRSPGKQCTEPATAPHVCPYKQEIYNDETLCQCCPACEEECGREI